MTASAESAGPTTIRSTYQPVMGTHLDVHVTAACDDEARRAETAAVVEALRIEARLTAFAPDSDLSRWRRGDLDGPGPDLAPVLALASAWHRRSGGAFSPFSGPLTERWLVAEADGIAPSRAELAELAGRAAELRIEHLDPAARTSIDLHAVAKGHVVDRVADHVGGLPSAPATRLVLNAGGDLVHRGAGSARIGVEDPFRPYDNRPPDRRIEIADEAVATSGQSRRWFRVGDQRFSRVLDPRTGWPVEHTTAATAIAPDTATADVVATVASVLAPAEAIAFVEGLRADDGLAVAALVLAADGTEHRTANWSDREI